VLKKVRKNHRKNDYFRQKGDLHARRQAAANIRNEVQLLKKKTMAVCSICFNKNI